MEGPVFGVKPLIGFNLNRVGLQSAKVEKDQAQIIKKALDGYNGALWHVIVGQAFGASVSHENRNLLLFRIGKVRQTVDYAYCRRSIVQTLAADAHPGVPVVRRGVAGAVGGRGRHRGRARWDAAGTASATRGARGQRRRRQRGGRGRSVMPPV